MSIVWLLSGCNENGNENAKFYGNVDVRTVSLSFRVAGKISKIRFDEGQKVKQGDVIATLDDALYQNRLAQTAAQVAIQQAKVDKLEKGFRTEEIDKARADLQQKQIALEKAKRDFDKQETLFRSRTISEQTYEDYKTVFESADAVYRVAKNSLLMLENGYEKEEIVGAKAQLEFLKLQNKEAQINLDDTVLYAPSNGTLLTKVYEDGSVVNASQIIIEMAKEDAYWVRSYLSEAYLGRIKEGMKALVYTDSHPDKTYEGVVSYVSPLAEFTPKSVQTETLRTDLVYQFRIILNDHDEMIRQGMPVTIFIPALESATK